MDTLIAPSQRLIGWGRQLKSIALALGFVLVVRTVVAEPYSVPSPSMVPTLLVGDELIGSKFAYGYGKYSSPIGLMPDFSGRLFDKAPERGDVIVFRLPRDPSTDLCEAPDRPARRPHPDAERAALHQRRPGAAPGHRHLRRRCRRTQRAVRPLCRDAAQRARARNRRDLRRRAARRHAGVRRAAEALLHDGRQPRQLPRQPHRRRRRRRRLRPGGQSGRPRRPAPAVARSGRRLVRRRRNGRTPSGWRGCSAASTSARSEA